MRRTNFLALLIMTLAVFVLAGCGGGTGVSSLPSRFAGTWTGTWTQSGTGQTGTMTGTVDSAGNFSGTIHNNTTGQDGTFKGAIGPAGVSTLAVTYSGGSYSGAGTFSINPDNHLVATLAISSTQGLLTLDLAGQ